MPDTKPPFSHALFSSMRPGQRNSKTQAERSAFEVDYDRIVFSESFRSLQNKTQVIPLPEHEFVHTRLTHSLEVSCVGRSLGRRIAPALLSRLTPNNHTEQDIAAIVAAACLAHDIGNPPFGHAGEAAISSFFRKHIPDGLNQAEIADLQNFEGNAQGFRLLVNRKDLSPTLATLATFTKYPCSSWFQGKNPNLKREKKFGFFQSEAEAFTHLASEINLKGNYPSWKRHPLSYLVEAADDICYLLIDLEDAVAMRRVMIGEYESMAASLLGKAMPFGENYKIRSHSAKAGMLRAMCIHHLIDEAVEAYENVLDNILEGNFELSMADIIPSQKTLKEIASFSVKHLYNAPEVLEVQAAGFHILPQLLEMTYAAMEEVMLKGKQAREADKNLFALIALPLTEKEQTNQYQRIRTLLDFISGLSDRQALNLFRKWTGATYPV